MSRWWIILAVFLCAYIANNAHGAELHWQQRDGEAPVHAWRVKRFQSPTPVATILRTLAVEETVTPGTWFPTPLPGTPSPVVRQYKAEVPMQGGWLIYLQSEDTRGLIGPDSNLKQIPTETPTPVNTQTPSHTRTQTGTKTATFARPEAPRILP